jgi:oxygen-dependent protoporphyrinogen oxidase
MVVNLYYRNPGLVAQRGFGYLIPRSVPFEQNPERALGVIFDHDAIQGQDSVEGTKLTVMLGGHWWDGWEGLPDSEEGKEMALSVLRRHLGIQVEPDLCHVTLNRNCIPQYTVGYEDRLASLGTQLQNDFNGRLRVVGSQYNGVGVNDCVRGAWQVARSMRGVGWRSRSAGPGIDRVQDGREWKVEPVLGMRNQERELEDRIREKFEQRKR